MSVFEDALLVYENQAKINIPGLTTATFEQVPDMDQPEGNFPHLEFSGYTMRVRERLVWQQEFQEFAFLGILTDSIDQPLKNTAMIDIFEQIDLVLQVNRTLSDTVKWAYHTGYTIVDNPVLQLERSQALFYEIIFEVIKG